MDGLDQFDENSNEGKEIEAMRFSRKALHQKITLSFEMICVGGRLGSGQSCPHTWAVVQTVRGWIDAPARNAQALDRGSGSVGPQKSDGNVIAITSRRTRTMRLIHAAIQSFEGEAAQGCSIMYADLFDAFLHALLYALGTVFCLFMLYGFWRGLSLRPHGHRPPPLDSD